MEDLMTPEEVALRLHVRPDTIKAWLRDGKLRGVKAGKLWRVPPHEVSRFLGLDSTSGSTSYPGQGES